MKMLADYLIGSSKLPVGVSMNGFMEITAFIFCECRAFLYLARVFVSGCVFCICFEFITVDIFCQNGV